MCCFPDRVGPLLSYQDYHILLLNLAGCLKDPGWTSGDATSSFYFIKDVEHLAAMANATGHIADAERYAHAAVAAREAYHTQCCARAAHPR